MSDQDSDYVNEQEDEVKQKFDRLCTTKGIKPPFERAQLTDLVMHQLQTIRDHWGTRIRRTARKPQMVETLLKDPNNVAAEWIKDLNDEEILLPPYDKNTLKYYKTGELVRHEQSTLVVPAPQPLPRLIPTGLNCNHVFLKSIIVLVTSLSAYGQQLPI